MCLMFRSSIISLLLVGLFSFCELAWGQDEEGLKAYYDFETEEATDQSGNNLHGAVEGVPKLIDGLEGKAWEFNGATRVQLDYQDFKNATPALSIRCLILPDDVKGGHLIYEEGGAWTGFCVRILDGDLQLGVVCCAEVHPPTAVASAKLPDRDDWIDIAAVFDNGTLFLYIDGKKVAEEKTEWPELGGHGQPGSIGGVGNGNTAFAEGEDVNDTPPGFFIGGIDELRVYQRALQPEEIKSAAVSAQDKLATTWGELKSGY